MCYHFGTLKLSGNVIIGYSNSSSGSLLVIIHEHTIPVCVLLAALVDVRTVVSARVREQLRCTAASGVTRSRPEVEPLSQLTTMVMLRILPLQLLQFIYCYCWKIVLSVIVITIKRRNRLSYRPRLKSRLSMILSQASIRLTFMQLTFTAISTVIVSLTRQLLRLVIIKLIKLVTCSSTF